MSNLSDGTDNQNGRMDHPMDHRIRDALRDLDTRVAHAVRDRQVHEVRPVPPSGPVRFVRPALAAMAVLVVLAGSVLAGNALIGGRQNKADSVTPMGKDTASQTPAAAAQDGVYPQVAALTWKQRAGAEVLRNSLSTVGGRTLRLELVRPDLSGITGFGADGCLAPVDEARAYPVCRNGEYTELLAIEANSRQIVRAYPLPAKMTWMTGAEGNLYCGRDGGDGDKALPGSVLPDSALCRLDLTTLELTGTLFQCDKPSGETKHESEDACGQGDKALNRYPGNWFESPKIRGAASIRVQGSLGLFVYAKDGRVTTTLDLHTLKTIPSPLF